MTFDEALEMELKRKRKPSSYLESKLQANCVRWFRFQFKDCLIFAIPNGGKRNEREAKIMKSEGVLAGVADLEVLMPDGRCVFIEMKTHEGRQSEAQRAFQKWCDEHSHTYKICRSLDEFIEFVNNIIKTQSNEKDFTS